MDKTAIDKMVIGQIEAQAGKEVEAVEPREPAVMAMEGIPENTTRGFLT